MTRAAIVVATVLAVWPAAAGADAVRLYARHCADCHGSKGRGDGPAAGMLSPPPRDFTSGHYKIRSTPSGTLPTPRDVTATIARGLPGTSMSGYETILRPEEIESLASLVLGMAPRTALRGSPIALADPRPASPSALRNGAALYGSLGCAACHGADGTPKGWRPTREGPGGPSPPADLSQPWTFRGGADPGSIALRVMTGLDGSAMPGYADAISARDAWDLAHHVASLARRPVWEERDPARIAVSGVSADPLERGRYLVNAMLCPLCHTPIGPRDGSYDTSRFLAGGMRVSAYPWGVWYSRNLTRDPETGLGRWSEEDVVRAVTRGLARDGRRLDPMAMPWPWFSALTAADARAIAVYLRSLPAIENPVPAPLRAPLAESVGAKMLMLLGAASSVDFWGGNAAVDPALRSGIPAPAGVRRAARLAGYTSLALVAGLMLAAARARRGRALALGAGLALAGAWTALSVWPPLALVGPDTAIRWLFLGAADPSRSLSGPEKALVERGRYVAALSPCGLCHTPASPFVGFLTGRTLAGGMEARWQVFGRAVSSNLTPHWRGGIGGLGDGALLAAMRSGIGPDGRRMHWQAMPWDIGSRWSEEDLRALIAYLRALPAVPGAAPPPRPAGFDDPPADSFYSGDAIAR